ncbi:hypothetical protein RUM44_003624 [Polyplax serrata]|uniref:Uncharacterized protein n=1 Tax=Polyplax serrata TaxID=468196 RepID=A0ABR1AH01_POLSC
MTGFLDTQRSDGTVKEEDGKSEEIPKLRARIGKEKVREKREEEAARAEGSGGKYRSQRDVGRGGSSSLCVNVGGIMEALSSDAPDTFGFLS